VAAHLLTLAAAFLTTLSFVTVASLRFLGWGLVGADLFCMKLAV
jgi:hypothetical protein